MFINFQKKSFSIKTLAIVFSFAMCFYSTTPMPTASADGSNLLGGGSGSSGGIAPGDVDPNNPNGGGENGSLLPQGPLGNAGDGGGDGDSGNNNGNNNNGSGGGNQFGDGSDNGDGEDGMRPYIIGQNDSIENEPGANYFLDGNGTQHKGTDAVRYSNGVFKSQPTQVTDTGDYLFDLKVNIGKYSYRYDNEDRTVRLYIFAKEPGTNGNGSYLGSIGIEVDENGVGTAQKTFSIKEGVREFNFRWYGDKRGDGKTTVDLNLAIESFSAEWDNETYHLNIPPNGLVTFTGRQAFHPDPPRVRVFEKNNDFMRLNRSEDGKGMRTWEMSVAIDGTYEVNYLLDMKIGNHGRFVPPLAGQTIQLEVFDQDNKSVGFVSGVVDEDEKVLLVGNLHLLTSTNNIMFEIPRNLDYWFPGGGDRNFISRSLQFEMIESDLDKLIRQRTTAIKDALAEIIVVNQIDIQDGIDSNLIIIDIDPDSLEVAVEVKDEFYEQLPNTLEHGVMFAGDALNTMRIHANPLTFMFEEVELDQHLVSADFEWRTLDEEDRLIRTYELEYKRIRDEDRLVHSKFTPNQIDLEQGHDFVTTNEIEYLLVGGGAFNPDGLGNQGELSGHIKVYTHQLNKGEPVEFEGHVAGIIDRYVTYAEERVLNGEVVGYWKNILEDYERVLNNVYNLFSRAIFNYIEQNFGTTNLKSLHDVKRWKDFSAPQTSADYWMILSNFEHLEDANKANLNVAGVPYTYRNLASVFFYDFWKYFFDCVYSEGGHASPGCGGDPGVGSPDPGGDGPGAPGPGGDGPGAPDPGGDGPGAPDPGGDGPGAAAGPGGDGPGVPDPGGAAGPGAPGPGGDGPGAPDPGGDGPGAAAGPGGDGPGVPDPGGAAGPGAPDPGGDGPGAPDPGGDGPGAPDPGGDGPGAPDPGGDDGPDDGDGGGDPGVGSGTGPGSPGGENCENTVLCPDGNHKKFCLPSQAGEMAIYSAQCARIGAEIQRRALAAQVAAMQQQANENNNNNNNNNNNGNNP